MTAVQQAAALTADVSAAHARLDTVVDAMPGLHGAALDRQARSAAALVNEAADLTAKIRLLGSGR